MTLGHDRIKELLERFRAAHADGMACLYRGDYDGFSEAIKRERVLIDALSAETEHRKKSFDASN